MRKNLLIIILLLACGSYSYSQLIINVRFMEEPTATIAAIPGYNFRGDYWFYITDSVACVYIKNRVDSLSVCTDSCQLPDVRQQIVIRDIQANRYDILSYNSWRMERNGKPVYFDQELYDYINRYIKAQKKAIGIPADIDEVIEKIWKEASKANKKNQKWNKKKLR